MNQIYNCDYWAITNRLAAQMAFNLIQQAMRLKGQIVLVSFI